MSGEVSSPRLRSPVTASADRDMSGAPNAAADADGGPVVAALDRAGDRVKTPAAVFDRTVDEVERRASCAAPPGSASWLPSS